jgi:hypothetical protein
VNNLSNCPNCGHPAQPDDKFCRNCGIPFRDRTPEHERFSETPPLTPIPPIPPPPPPPTMGMDSASTPPLEDKHVPWEEREKYGFFEALWETWKESIVNPDRFFEKMPYKGGLGSPILYMVIIGTISAVIGAFYGIIFSTTTNAILGRVLSRYGEQAVLNHINPLWSFISIPLAPIGVVIALFVLSGIFHLIGVIFGWAKRDFEATLRAVAYSWGPFAFTIIPFCGSTIANVWAMILIIIGYKHMQQTTSGKAAVTVLLPLILCCCLAGILVAIFFTTIIALIGGAAGSGIWDKF